MRRVRYAVAMSVDGYIAGPNGEADWIVMDPAIDFRELFEEFDTVIMGRRTFEVMANESNAGMSGMKTVVFSQTLLQRDYPGTIVSAAPETTVAALRAEPGKDIWLFGGGVLFRSLAAARLVDTVELAVIPVLLGGGTPVLAAPAERGKLKLTEHRVYKTGIVSLKYAMT